MQINDVLSQIGGIQSLAKTLGVSENEALKGASALLPAILGGFKKQTQSSTNGFDSIGGLLGQLGSSGLLDGLLKGQSTEANSGNAILGQIFGSKDISRTVAEDAAARSGLDASLLKKMLPVLAMLVTSYLNKQSGGDTAQASSGLGGLIGGLLGGEKSQAGGLAKLASLLDTDGDGNPLDDILKLAGKSIR